MRLQLLVVAPLLALMPWLVHAKEGWEWNGNRMLPGCTAVVQELDGKPAAKTPEGFKCVGFVAGYLAGHITSFSAVARKTGKLNEPSNMSGLNKTVARYLPICIPEDATVPQLIRIFTQYMKDNPQELHMYAGSLLEFALMKAFPCRSL